MYFNRYNILWITVLGVLFFTSYGAVNHISAYFDTIQTVPSLVFKWEKNIPFVPIFIYPYMSIDFLYGLAFFIIAKNQYDEKKYKLIIKGLGLQLLANQLFSLLCFLSFPLKFSFAKPDIHQNYKPIFDALLSFDLPYNQAPSLHISILIILVVFYWQHLKNIYLKIALNIWFFLIALSVLFTYQHHFIDLILGAYLGIAIVVMFNYSPHNKPSLHTENNLLNNAIYKKYIWGIFLSGLILYVLPILNNFGVLKFHIPKTLYILLLVFQISFLTCFKIMFFGNHFSIRNHKSNFTWFFLIPSYFYLKAREITITIFDYYNSPIQITEKLYIGNLFSIRNVTPEPHIVFINLTWECDNKQENSISLPLVDLIHPSTNQIILICKKINEEISKGKTVYLHCALGMFRTIIVLSSYLTLYENKTPQEVFDLLENSPIHRTVKEYIIARKEKISFILSKLKK